MKTIDRIAASGEVNSDLSAPQRAALAAASRSTLSDQFDSEPVSPPPASPRDLAASRAKLLNALAGAADITLIRSYGNTGDQLIYAGTRQLLADIAYREVSLRQLDGARGQLAVITGGGAWCQPHWHMTEYLPRIEAQFKRVIVFPSSFDVAQEQVRQVLSRSQALIFAREQVSYEQIRDLCQADLAHDGAFFYDYGPYQAQGRGLLTAYRTDREAAGYALPPGNDDISVTCETLDEWLWMIARHAVVETDRAHVMIAAALLGKRVYYRTSGYHKVPAIAEFALGNYAVTRLGDSRAEVISELFRQERALAARSPADFIAAQVAAFEAELAARANEVARLNEELALRRDELCAQRNELAALAQALAQSRSEGEALATQAGARQSAWEQLQALAARREQELTVIFNSRCWRAVDFYWRARRALRTIVTRPGDAGRR